MLGVPAPNVLYVLVDPVKTLLQDGSRVGKMERSDLWLVRVRCSKAGLLKSRDLEAAVDKATSKYTSFIASGRRLEFDNYLFLNRADAEAFKERIETSMKQRVSPTFKVKADIIEVTPEEVAHLDLDPAQR